MVSFRRNKECQILFENREKEINKYVLKQYFYKSKMKEGHRDLLYFLYLQKFENIEN